MSEASTVPWDLTIPVMLDWFDIVADELLSRQPDVDFDFTRQDIDNLYTGAHRGFSSHRWGFWADRMERLSGDGMFDDETQARLLKAAKRIRTSISGE